jgi:hypothetical protein
VAAGEGAVERAAGDGRADELHEPAGRRLADLLVGLRAQPVERAPKVRGELVLVAVDGRDDLLARQPVTLVADDVGEDLAALALPVGAHAAQVLVDVVRVGQADRLDLDDLRDDVRGHRVRPRQVHEVERELLQVVDVGGVGEVGGQRHFGLLLEARLLGSVVLGGDPLERGEDLRVHGQ